MATKEPKPVGRPHVGQPISVALTDEQRDWIDKRAVLTERSRSDVIRRVIQDAMLSETDLGF